MRRIVVVAVALLIGAWWSQSRRARPAVPDVAKTEHVLDDLAAYGSGLQWETTNGRVPLQGDGVEFRTTQDTPASISVAVHAASIETQTWRIIVNLDLVTEVVCERHFIHVPEPALILLYVSFRKGPDHDGVPDTLFTVRFDQAREDDFIALCERHGLRKDALWRRATADPIAARSRSTLRDG
jgi:hypothetical protein